VTENTAEKHLAVLWPPIYVTFRHILTLHHTLSPLCLSTNGQYTILRPALVTDLKQLIIIIWELDKGPVRGPVPQGTVSPNRNNNNSQHETAVNCDVEA
jgi:hypothetical protein